jgi:hypothetical protein
LAIIKKESREKDISDTGIKKAIGEEHMKGKLTIVVIGDGLRRE